MTYPPITIIFSFIKVAFQMRKRVINRRKSFSPSRQSNGNILPKDVTLSVRSQSGPCRGRRFNQKHLSASPHLDCSTTLVSCDNPLTHSAPPLHFIDNRLTLTCLKYPAAPLSYWFSSHQNTNYHWLHRSLLFPLAELLVAYHIRLLERGEKKREVIFFFPKIPPPDTLQEYWLTAERHQGKYKYFGHDYF